MNAPRLLPLALFLLSPAFSLSVSAHGVERGALELSLLSSALVMLPETSVRAAEMVESRCDLTGAVSVTAEVAQEERTVNALDGHEMQIRFNIVVDYQPSPVLVLVRARRSRFAPPVAEPPALTIESPICR